MEFERKLIGVPDALFDTLEDYPTETAWEVFQAVRAYVHFWDIHRTDDGFDVSAMSADGKAVFRSVVKKLRQYSADYYGVRLEEGSEMTALAAKTASVPVREAQASHNGTLAVIDETDSDNACDGVKNGTQTTAAMARKKERLRKKKWRKKKAKVLKEDKRDIKTGSTPCATRDSGENFGLEVLKEDKRDIKTGSTPCATRDSGGNFCSEVLKEDRRDIKTGSTPCATRDSGDFSLAHVYILFKLLDYNYSNSKDYWKGGMGENQVIHNKGVDNPVDNLNHGGSVNSNPTSGLSGSKAVSVAAVPATSDSKEEGRKGEREDRDLPAAEAAGGDSKAEACAGGAGEPLVERGDNLNSLERQAQTPFAGRSCLSENSKRHGLRPGSAKEVCGDAPSAKEFHLLSAPHAVTVGEVFIDRNFKIDFSNEFFSPYRKADGFLRRGVEKWLIANKYGCSVEKRWICGLIYKFARRQGKVATLLGADPPPDVS